MKRVILVAAIAGGMPTLAVAGDIFGTITEADKPVANAPVTVTIAGRPPYTGATDGGGSYRVFVPETGKATLTVTAGGRPHTIDVFSSERAARYDLVIGPDGGLRRR